MHGQEGTEEVTKAPSFEGESWCGAEDSRCSVSKERGWVTARQGPRSTRPADVIIKYNCVNGQSVVDPELAHMRLGNMVELQALAGETTLTFGVKGSPFASNGRITIPAGQSRTRRVTKPRDRYRYLHDIEGCDELTGTPEMIVG